MSANGGDGSDIYEILGKADEIYIAYHGMKTHVTQGHVK